MRCAYSQFFLPSFSKRTGKICEGIQTDNFGHVATFPFSPTEIGFLWEKNGIVAKLGRKLPMRVQITHKKCPVIPSWGKAAILDFQNGGSHMNFLHISASRWHKLTIWVANHMFFGMGEPMPTIKTYKHMTKGQLWLSRTEFSLVYMTFFISAYGKNILQIKPISKKIYQML